MHQNPQILLVAPRTHPCAAAFSSRSQGGFATIQGITLVELAIVVAIIAVLMALLTIPIKMVIETARSTKCRGNEGQLYQAFKFYAADWRGRLPPNNLFFDQLPDHLVVPQVKYTNWINVLARESGIVSGNYEKLLGGKPRPWVDMDWGGIRSGPFLCPEVRSQTNASPTWYFGGYGVITTCSSHKGPKFSNGVGLLLMRISNPSSRAMLMDGDMGIRCPGGIPAGSNSWYPEPWTSSKGDSSGAKARHANQTRANVLFYDGSVRTVFYRDLRDNVDDIFGHSN